jgi:hypothetical protein
MKDSAIVCMKRAHYRSLFRANQGKYENNSIFAAVYAIGDWLRVTDTIRSGQALYIHPFKENGLTL